MEAHELLGEATLVKVENVSWKQILITDVNCYWTLSANYAECHKLSLYANCRYTECRCGECHGAKIINMFPS